MNKNQRDDDLIPYPRCCETSRRYELVLAITSCFEDSDERDPEDPSLPRISWAWALPRDPRRSTLPMEVRRDMAYCPPPPTHCPFCQTELPRFRLRLEVPKGRIAGPGPDYCETCDERVYTCSCRDIRLRWTCDPPK